MGDEGVAFDVQGVAADITPLLENFLPFIRDRISKNAVGGPSFLKGGGVLF